LALSFQDNAGCLDIWRQITHVQSRAAEWFRTHTDSVTDMAHAAAAAHHADLQRQQQHAMWVNVASEAAQHHLEHVMNYTSCDKDSNAEAVAVSMAAAAAAAYGNDTTVQQPSLPNPPTLQNLEEIADIIAAAQVSIMYYVYFILLEKVLTHYYSNCNRENRWLYTCQETIVPI